MLIVSIGRQGVILWTYRVKSIQKHEVTIWSIRMALTFEEIKLGAFVNIGIHDSISKVSR